MHLLVPFSAVLSIVAAQSIVVQVGSSASAQGGVFQYIPSSFTAANGTTVTFRFTGAPGNHTVTQSTFANPCNPVSGGFDSGWVVIPATNVSRTPEWNLTITDDTKPIWFYCKQLLPTPHCAAGMVGAINPPTSGNNTFQTFQSSARAFTGTPGQGEGALAGVGASASAVPGPITGGASLITAGPTPTATSPSSSSSANPTPSHSSSAMRTGAASSLLLLLAAAAGIHIA
ncbi:hypothetical protein L208DRAFT_1389333 [Tricholoma matsutake]|nr:hypothetical protein L208DRAFT_1389333 [Tricholoma matsutake 945]